MSAEKTMNKNDWKSVLRHFVDAAIGFIFVPVAITVGDRVMDAIQTGTINLATPDFKVIVTIIGSAVLAGTGAGIKRWWERYRMDLEKTSVPVA